VDIELLRIERRIEPTEHAVGLGLNILSGTELSLSYMTWQGHGLHVMVQHTRSRLVPPHRPYFFKSPPPSSVARNH
jgi:hypothetical protein